MEPLIEYDKKRTDSTAELHIEITNQNNFPMDIRWVDLNLTGYYETGEEIPSSGIPFSIGTSTWGKRLPFGRIMLTSSDNVEVSTEVNDEFPIHINALSTGYFVVDFCRFPKPSPSRHPDIIGLSSPSITMTSMSEAEAIQSERSNAKIQLAISIKNPTDGPNFVEEKTIYLTDPGNLPECPTPTSRLEEDRKKLEGMYLDACLKSPLCDPYKLIERLSTD
ncbi:hypothetical protein [Marinobacter sp. F4218]|uniref:hypothetical protein n=1 Tax=Marinobacter sp. F4218 TaxID=2862868 RepID=UPI001C634A29|nr:hypothetical protein [Marinobacter sp. F4218]MBW7471162.1 hypothetical protein [Marinobacter sp. F4218]